MEVQTLKPARNTVKQRFELNAKIFYEMLFPDCGIFYSIVENSLQKLTPYGRHYKGENKKARLFLNSQAFFISKLSVNQTSSSLNNFAVK